MPVAGFDPNCVVLLQAKLDELSSQVVIPTRGNVLFDRHCVVDAAGVQLDSDELTVYFDVSADTENTNNDVTVTTYNLTADTISKLVRNQPFTITAGYRGDEGILFQGRIGKVQTTREGADKKTMIYAMDSEDLDKKGTYSTTYGKNTRSSSIIQDQASKLGLPIGKLQVTNDFAHKKSYTVHTDPMKCIQDEAKRCNANCYINKGKLYVVDGDFAQDSGYVLTPDTGLISSPEEFEEEKTIKESNIKSSGSGAVASKGSRTTADSSKASGGGSSGTSSKKSSTKKKAEKKTVKGFNVKSLMNHRFDPNVKIYIESSTANGLFTIRKVRHTWNGQSFYSEMEVV